MVNALKQVVDKSKDTQGNVRLDAILVPGDITHNSNPAEYQAMINDFNSIPEIKANNVKVMFLRGNHDVQDGKGDNFVKELSKYDSTLTKTNNIYDIKGYKFICVSQDTYKYNDDTPEKYEYVHSPQTIEWFENAMNDAAAESNGKPIFVAMHPAVKDTVFGSSPIAGFKNGASASSSYWATSELYNGLKNHSNAITFAGHSHWTMANERSIHQKEFTSLNTGAVNNMEIENCWDENYMPRRFGSSNENESSGYYIEVDADEKVSIHRLDLFRNTEFGDPWIVDVNDKENWQYTDNRDTTAPYFDSSAAVTVSDITETSCHVIFTQAEDDESAVNNYAVEIIDTATGETVKKATPSSYYWLKHANAMPAENNWSFSGLEAGKEYKAVITAYDTFYNVSEPVESDVFKTRSLPEIPDNPEELYHMDVTTAAKKLNDDGVEVWDWEKSGITADSSVTWTPAIESTNSSMHIEAMRFSTKKNQTGKLMKLDFANDQVLNPSPFNEDGTYIIDTEFGVLHKLSGYVSYKLYGKNAGGSENAVAEIRFNAAKDGNGSVNAVNAAGEQIGNKIPVIVGPATESWVGQYVCARTIINLDRQTYSVYIAPVRTGSDDTYHEPEFAAATLLVNNAPLNMENVSEISALGFDISGDTATFGVWMTAITVSHAQESIIDDETKINFNSSSVTAGETISVSADIADADKDAELNLYIASYSDNILTSINKISKGSSSASSIEGSFTVPSQSETVKIFLWDTDMLPYDMKTITVE